MNIATEKCYVVNHRCYSGDNYSLVFWKEEHARKCMWDDLRIVEKEMLSYMYNYNIVSSIDSVELYVVGGDIYYEWEIVKTTIG